MKKTELDLNLKTPSEPCSDAWNEYPRPQLKRGQWMNLNGKWDLSVRDTRGNDVHIGDIVVANSSEYGGIIKRIDKINGDNIHLISDNKQISYEYINGILFNNTFCPSCNVGSIDVPST